MDTIEINKTDKITQYRQIIKKVLVPLTERRYSNADLTNESVFDDENNRYIVVSVGWQNNTRRMHGCLVHLDIINEKIWIQRDGTEYGIAYELEAEGVPKSDIVLAIHHETVRPHTGYAVA
jgi:hypothetical protein